MCCWRYSLRYLTYIGELAVDISLFLSLPREQSRARKIYIYICNFLPVRAELGMDASKQKKEKRKKKKKKRGNAFVVVVAPLL